MQLKCPECEGMVMNKVGFVLDDDDIYNCGKCRKIYKPVITYVHVGNLKDDPVEKNG